MKAPRVTDHAVLRYLERAKGLDVDAVRRHIAALCAPGAAVGATCVRAEGLRFCLTRDGAVTTVAPQSTFVSRTTQDRLGGGRR